MVRAPAQAALAPPPATLDEVFRTEGAFVLRTVRRLGASSGDAEDLAQQVFLVLHRRPELLASAASPRALLFGIVRRVLSDHRRRARPTQTVEAGVLSVDAAQERSVSRREARAMLERALDTLGAEQREVFVLYELEAMPMREVAALVEVPLQTAYSRLHAARDAVRSALAGEELP